MSRVSQTFITQMIANGGVYPLTALRNWHDRIMRFNQGRGFDISLMAVPDNGVPHLAFYVNGELQEDSEFDFPKSFNTFTGYVEGLMTDDKGFLAMNYFDLDQNRTPHATYLEASFVLQDAGFNVAAVYETAGNGWNNLENFVNHYKTQSYCKGWLVLPSIPRIAENAAMQNYPPCAMVESLKVEETMTTKKMSASDKTPEPTEAPETVWKYCVSGRFKDPTRAEVIAHLEGLDRKVEIVKDFKEADYVVVMTENINTGAAKYARRDDNDVILVTPAQLSITKE